MTGPREEKLAIVSPTSLSNSISNETVLFPAANSASNFWPSASVARTVGSARPGTFGTSPATLLYIMTPVAPAFFAFSTLSTKANSPREIKAILPVRSLPAKSAAPPSPTLTNSNSPSFKARSASSFGKPIVSTEGYETPSEVNRSALNKLKGSCVAPTEIASREVPGEPTVQLFGPLLPFDVTATTPSAIAVSSAMLVA